MNYVTVCLFPELDYNRNEEKVIRFGTEENEVLSVRRADLVSYRRVSKQ